MPAHRRPFPRLPHTARTKLGVVCTLGVCLLGVSGCNIVAPIFMIAKGPPKTAAVHELKPERPTIVFVDDRDNRLPRRSMRLAMAKTAEAALLKSEAVKDVISADAGIALAAQDDPDKPMSISELGRGVQADVVIYATVDAFELSPDGGQTYAPFANLRVTVIDAKEDKRIWPVKDAGGYPLRVQMPAKASEPPGTAGAVMAVQTELAELAGRNIAELFYKHLTDRSVKMPD